MPAKPEWIENKYEYFLHCQNCNKKATLLSKVGSIHVCEKCFNSKNLQTRKNKHGKR